MGANMPWDTRSVRALYLLGLATGCFDPHPQPGSPCSESEPCPSGLVCTFGACQLEVEPAPDGANPGDGGNCFGTVVRVCLAAPPSAPVVVAGDALVDTDTAPECAQSDAPGLCVIAGGSVSIAGTLRATGARPLVLLSAGSMFVEGVVDVASHRADATTGAAADAPDCTTPVPDASTGGPGGSFGGRGGAGAGNGGTLPSGPPALAPALLRGGCAGSTGGNNMGGTGGAGGSGGGAVILIAGTLAIAGTINASGAGGGGGKLTGTGGGGGSGGLIVLDATAISLAADANVLANGGGGGSADFVVLPGQPGDDPAEPDVPARGGLGSGGGGGGGAGSFVGRDDGIDGKAPGGGGGGGAGVVRVAGQLFGETSGISPQPR